MKIAVATEQQDVNAEISRNFGRSAYFLIFDADGNLLDMISNAPPSHARGAGHRAAKILKDLGVTHVIAGHFGPEAEADLGDAGIEIFKHAGRANNAVRELH